MDERARENSLEARVRALEIRAERADGELAHAREERARSQAVLEQLASARQIEQAVSARRLSGRGRFLAWTVGLVTVFATVGNFVLTLLAAGGRA